MTLGLFYIDGVPYRANENFSIRFVMEKKEPVAVLYLGGKRVTKAWEFYLTANQDADLIGAGANTE